ncbi:MAG TPA: hypothetical protein VHN80_10360, partial [Kineosporiaceae bacterium]|nr:hypothetical protein [Kineosporiaceae bacterium]
MSRPTRRTAGSALVLALWMTLTLLASPAGADADRAAATTAARTARTSRTTADPARVAGPVVLIGTGGLRWDDVGDTTPALFALLGEGAVGTLAVRSVGLSSCPVDGWLAVSAGRRAADSPTAQGEPDCRTPSVTIGTASTIGTAGTAGGPG